MSFTGCVILGKCLNLSEPHFPHLSNGMCHGLVSSKCIPACKVFGTVPGTLKVLHQGWIVIADMEGHVPEWVGEEKRLGRGGLRSGPGLFTCF